MSQKTKDIWINGFALFAIFFGAGNVIFPPQLGLQTGADWAVGFASFTFADAGLALVAIIALMQKDGTMERMLERLGKAPAFLLSAICFLCIGPFLAIPRTAATTFEMAIAPSLDLPSVPFAFIYFAIVFILTVRPTQVVDIIGKILTPALYISLLALIVLGIVTPIGPIVDTGYDGAFLSGLLSGYQTMDVIGAGVTTTLIISALSKKGYGEKDRMNITIRSGVIAACGLMLVYGGLTYLGATASTIYPADTPKVELLLNIVRHLSGNGGLILLAIVVSLACLTTAIGLTSSVASFFARFIPGKNGYAILVGAICLFSAVVSNFGIQTIIEFSAPVLGIIYPAVLAMIFLSFFEKKISNVNVFRFSTFGALLASCFTTLAPFFVPSLALVLPLSKYGFGWLLPAVVCGVIGWFVKPKSIKAA